MYLTELIVLTRCLVITFLLGHSATVFAKDSIVFTCSLDKTEPQYDEMLSLYRDAFGAMGFDFSFLKASGVRSYVSAASGNTDGECTRVHRFIEITGAPNLVRVDAAVLNMDVQVWSRSHQESMLTNEKLSKPGRRIGYRRGFKWLEDYFDRQQDIELTAVNSTHLGLKMLAAKRLDLYIGSGMQIKNSLNGIKLQQPIYLTGSLGKLDFYPYLHIRNKHLAGPLAVELKRLIDSRGGPVK